MATCTSCALGSLVSKPRGQPPGESFAVIEQAFKGDRAGERAVVEEDGDASAFVQLDQVGAVGCRPRRWESRSSERVGAIQSGQSGLQGGLRALANAGALVGRKDGEEDAVLGQQVQGLAIDSGFRQPHAFRLAAEAMLEVGDAPADLGDAVARRWPGA